MLKIDKNDKKWFPFIFKFFSPISIALSLLAKIRIQNTTRFWICYRKYYVDPIRLKISSSIICGLNLPRNLPSNKNTEEWGELFWGLKAEACAEEMGNSRKDWIPKHCGGSEIQVRTSKIVFFSPETAITKHSTWTLSPSETSFFISSSSWKLPLITPSDNINLLLLPFSHGPLLWRMCLVAVSYVLSISPLLETQVIEIEPIQT